MASEGTSDRDRMIRAMSAPTAASPGSLVGSGTDDEKFIGPKLPGQTRAKGSLAFLPNLVPTYKTGSDDPADDNGVHMFSLVFQQPKIEQGWRLMLRFGMKKLLVDATTLSILERLGAVDWVPLPGGVTDGAAGIYCYIPESGAASLLREKALKDAPTDALDEAIDALGRWSLETAEGAGGEGVVEVVE